MDAAVHGCSYRGAILGYGVEVHRAAVGAVSLWKAGRPLAEDGLTRLAGRDMCRSALFPDLSGNLSRNPFRVKYS